MGRLWTGIGWLAAVCAASVLLAACGGSKTTVTTVIERVPASTTTTTSTGTSPTTTVSGPTTVTQVVTQTTATASAPCLASALYAAAGQKEHFNADSPGYSADVQPGATVLECYEGWATAGVSRPDVGTTDGLTLFESVDGVWREVTQLGDVAVECDLEPHGVPAAVAAVLSRDVVGSGAAGCDDPDAYSEAREEWKSSYCDPLSQQTQDWIATYQALEGAQPAYAGNPTGYKAAISELKQLSTIPQSGGGSSQIDAEEHSDATAVDAFLNTPGLFVSASEPTCSG